MQWPIQEHFDKWLLEQVVNILLNQGQLNIRLGGGAGAERAMIKGAVAL